MTPSRSATSFDSVPIIYDVEGDRPETIVFVHGWACNRSHWQGQMKTFSPHYRTIAIDLAGHGESGLGRSEWTMGSFARDVAAVMEQELVERAVVVGHSMGGRVMLHVAQQLGQRVMGLVGADTLKYPRQNPRAGYVERIRAMEDNYEVGALALVSTMFTGDTPDSLRESVTEGMLATPAAVAIGATAGMAADVPSFGLAATLDVPITVINAYGSRVDMDAAGEAGIDVRFVTTTGHFVMIEDPETFNRLLGEALERMF